MNAHQSIERKYIIMKVLERMSVSWFFATYVYFLLSNGQSPKEANFLNVIFMVSIFLFDPPTGSLGDRLGHRRVYLAGLVVHAVAFVIYGMGHLFLHFAIAEFTGAIGSSLMSEALEAWLRNETDDETFNAVRSKAKERGQYFGILPALIGSIVGSQISYAIPWFLSGISFLIAFGIGIFVLKDGDDVHNLKNVGIVEIVGIDAMKKEFRNIREGFTIIWNSPELLKNGVVTMAVFAAFQPINMFWSLCFRELGSPEWLMGIFWILIALAAGKGAGVVKSMKTITHVQVGTAIWRIGASLGVGAVIALLSKYAGYASSGVVIVLLVGFLAHEYYRGSLDELLSTYRNRFIEKPLRATINSSLGSLRTLGAAAGLLLSGVASDVLPTLVIWTVSALLLLLVGVWYVRHKPIQ